MNGRTLTIVFIAAFLLTLRPAPGQILDKEYITGWLSIIYPDPQIDGNSAYIIDGIVYEDSEVDVILAKREQEGGRISYLDYIAGEKFYENRYVNRRQWTSIILLRTTQERRKEVRKKLKAFRERPEEFYPIQAGIITMADEVGRDCVGSYRVKDYYGIQIIETPDASSPEGFIKSMVLWLK